ncbi:uncharacterized protein LOC124349954 [Daphnia pulicaria]|uniref:uncharacterized protein LOC124349954 n=1 Tax=Daphnia pulicaria TaxID=35523 RepID=UPI001EEB5C9B|nr:uncharacterized protein LOC124349954 [Daphnia pulicaria]
MENVVDTPDISEFIIFVKKFADLVCVEFRHDDMEHWDVFSNKFRFSPNEKVEDGFFPVRAIIDSNGHVKLKVLNFIAREADWKIQRTEAEVIIRSLSYYGHRHKFCPGIFLASEFCCLEGDPLSKTIIFSQFPYEHYRSSQCSYFYSSTFKSSHNKIVTASKCTNCRKMYSNRKAAKKTQLLPNPPPKRVKCSLQKEKQVEEKNGDIQSATANLDKQRRSNRIKVVIEEIQNEKVTGDFDAIYLPE